MRAAVAMPWRRLHTAALLLAAGLAAMPSARAEPAVSRFKLANGLDVVVVPDRRLPVVTHMVLYRAGGADEPLGRSGLAHLLEHMMFKATERIKSGEFSRIISRLGGIDNAVTTADVTYYYQRVAKDRLARVMQLEADRMLSIRIEQAEVETERMVVLEERRSQVEADPISLLSEQMLAALYQNHPYGKPVLGWPHELPQLTGSDALAFYKRFYAPNNAILLVVGDVTGDEVRRLAETVYGPLPAGPPLAERVRPSEPPPRASRRIVMQDPRAGSPTLVRFYLTPGAATATGREAEALEALARVLGGGDTSRLAVRLVDEQKIALAAAAMFVGNARDSGRLAVFALPAPGRDLAELEQRLDQVIADLVKGGVSDDELAQARASMAAKRVLEADSQLERARQLGEALTHGLSLEHIQSAPQRLAGLSRDDIATAARRYLEARRSVTGVLLPAPAESASEGRRP